jgi:hypothetical protein
MQVSAPSLSTRPPKCCAPCAMPTHTFEHLRSSLRKLHSAVFYALCSELNYRRPQPTKPIKQPITSACGFSASRGKGGWLTLLGCELI